MLIPSKTFLRSSLSPRYFNPFLTCTANILELIKFGRISFFRMHTIFVFKLVVIEGLWGGWKDDELDGLVLKL
jgi:hypothetical protein